MLCLKVVDLKEKSKYDGYSRLMPLCPENGNLMLKSLKAFDLAPMISSKMPVDLSPYLLASSPPASFEFLSSAFSQPKLDGAWGLPAVDRKQGYCEENVNCMISKLDKELCFQNDKKHCDRNERLKPIITRCNSTGSEDDEDFSYSSDSSSGSQSPRPNSPGKMKKKVSFADHRGLALATVKIMNEPSHMPPRLSPSVLKIITQGATAGVTDQEPLALNFAQPASDYLVFRDHLEQNCVSLENVILRNYTVMGTIKVKNICFHKEVLLRCTFDSWESSVEFAANFVNNLGNTKNVYDTFSFEFEVPANFDKDKKIEFAVCFREESKTEHWDNNGGKNYQISSAVLQPLADPCIAVPANKTERSKDILRNVDSWTQFACWNKVDTNVPYW